MWLGPFCLLSITSLISSLTIIACNGAIIPCNRLAGDRGESCVHNWSFIAPTQYATCMLATAKLQNVGHSYMCSYLVLSVYCRLVQQDGLLCQQHHITIIYESVKCHKDPDTKHIRHISGWSSDIMTEPWPLLDQLMTPKPIERANTASSGSAH